MRVRLPTLGNNLFTLWLGTLLWVLAATCFAAASYCVPYFVMTEALSTNPPGLTTPDTWGLRMIACLAGTTLFSGVAAWLIICPPGSKQD